MLWNTLANGSLGTCDSSITDNGGGSYSIVITSATWKLANWEIRDFVNIETGNTDLFEITAVVGSTRTVTVQRLTGSQVPVNGDVIFLQGSEGNDITSFAYVAEQSSSTAYSVTVGTRWQAYQKNASSAGISSDLLNDVMLGVEEQSGVTPSAIYCGYTQMRKLLNTIEDAKYYQVGSVGPRATNLQGVVSFPSIQFASTAGPVPILVDRFCETDTSYATSEDNVELLHAPDMGWHEDEGFVFLRKAASDAYEARFGAYMENYSPPPVHGVLYGLSTS